MTDLVTMGWAAISWIEHYLVHGPGDVQGQLIELDDEFAAFILKAYRLDPKTGERVVRRAFLSRSKGRSKSGVAAMIECFEVIGPAPAHMPRLVQAVQAAVGIARARFCVWCSGTESHKMSCSALMTGHVGEREPCQERDLRALAGAG